MGTHKILYEDFLQPLMRGERSKSGGPPGDHLLFVGQDSSAALRARFPKGKGGTWNFKRMGRTAKLSYEVQFGTPQGIGEALELIRDMLRLENEIGLWGREQTPNDPHALYHLAPEIAMRQAARIGVQKGLPWAAPLLAESTSRMLAIRDLYAAVATPDGEVLGPCTRAGSTRQHTETPPVTQVGTAFYRLLARLEHQGPAGGHGESFWKDETYGLSLAYFRNMLYKPGPINTLHRRAGFDGPDAELIRALGVGPRNVLPKVRLSLRVHRYADGHVAEISGAEEGEPIVSAVRVKYGRPGSHGLAYVHNWRDSIDSRPMGRLVTKLESDRRV